MLGGKKSDLKAKDGHTVFPKTIWPSTQARHIRHCEIQDGLCD